MFVLESSLSPEEYLPESILIVVDEAVYPEIESRIATYKNDISNEGISSTVILFDTTDDCTDIKAVLQSYNGSAQCGFFIGDIAPAWYEQVAFGEEEVFPSDLYYMDLDSTWTDADGDGYYDSHSDLEVDFYVSRVTGTADEINFYFDKLHNYRTNSKSVPIYDGAFIFKDDDWHNNYRSNDFGLKSIYGSVDFYQDDGNTTKSSYLSKMTAAGTEYVYQWIHAFPPALFVAVDGSYEVIKAADIEDLNVKGNFYNLFDCQAARFTVNNLAANYLTKTDSCIAVIGSTKTGGIYYPVEFHKSLGVGACWGASYKAWYNTEGVEDDTWFLGIITMGDPTIRPHNASGSNMATGSKSVSNIIPLSKAEKDDMFLQLRSFTPDIELSDDLIDEMRQSLSDY